MDPGAKFVTFVPLVPIVAVMVVLSGGSWDRWRVAGLVLLVMGMTLLTVARLQLGNSFSVTPQAKVLVTRGIYSKIRHPVYVFSAIALVGMALYVPVHWLLLLLLPIIPMQVWRARREEKVLIARFGEEYTRYKATTWF